MQKDPLNFLDSTFKFLLALIVTISIILFVGILYCHAGEVNRHTVAFDVVTKI